MWGRVDLFTKATASVPVLLYTTEQICVAHFLVYLFRRWRIKEEKCNVHGDESRDASPCNWCLEHGITCMTPKYTVGRVKGSKKYVPISW